MITVRFQDGLRASIDSGIWVCAEPTRQQVLRNNESFRIQYEFFGDKPDQDMAAAQYAVDTLAVKIIDISKHSVPQSLPDVVY